MKACTDECYRHYYATSEISLKHASWLVNGYDPRIDNPTYDLRSIDSNYRSIKKQFSLNTAVDLIDTKIFFKWAAEKWPDFKKNLPIDLIVNTAQCEATIPSISVQAFSLPDDPAELRKAAIEIHLDKANKDAQLSTLKTTNAELNHNSDQYKRYRKAQSNRAKKKRERY